MDCLKKGRNTPFIFTNTSGSQVSMSILLSSRKYYWDRCLSVDGIKKGIEEIGVIFRKFETSISEELVVLEFTACPIILFF